MKRTLFTTSCLLLSASLPAIADISTERQTELLYLLKQDCGSCHGMTLKGGLGPALLPENLNGKPRELLVATIMEGRNGTAMPPWKALLTHDEAEWITVQLQQGIK